MKKYGIHVIICAVIFAVAFGFNQKINTERSHEYTLSEAVTTLLKDVKLEEEAGALSFNGWGFDTKYYNEDVKNEIILQDTETGEAVWPKMEKNPEPVEISDRYTDGKDYSKARFTGRIRENQLKKDSVYEILLRYTCSYRDEAGTEQSYVRTVTTDEFLYQGEMTEYNPKMFFVKHFSLKKASEFPSFSKGFSLFPAGIMHPCA